MEFAEILHALSGLVVVGFGLFLIGLAALIFIMPSRAEVFLTGFASSAVTHYTEQALRLIVGAAIVSFAGSMRHPELFNAFGWLIVVSTGGLLLVPWQWHNRFSKLVMPQVFQRMKLFALGACILGAFILTCAFQAGSSKR